MSYNITLKIKFTTKFIKFGMQNISLPAVCEEIITNNETVATLLTLTLSAVTLRFRRFPPLLVSVVLSLYPLLVQVEVGDCCKAWKK